MCVSLVICLFWCFNYFDGALWFCLCSGVGFPCECWVLILALL